MASTAAAISPLPGRTKNKSISGVSRTSLKPLRIIPTTCEQCPAGCGVHAQLNGERLIQILGNPDHPVNQGSICAKGIAGINLVNDPERLLYPMKREGARGDNQWTRITWDEVYSTLSERIKKLMRDKRTGEFMVDIGQTDPLLDILISALGKPHVIDRPAFKNLNRDTAIFSMTGQPFLVEDIGRSRTVLNFGANPYANHDRFIGMARRLIHAQVEHGTRLITLDVRMSETAAKSDAWYPIKAGTDAIVALAMAHIIIDNDLVDEDFIERRSNYPLSKIKQHISKYTPEAAESESGVKAADIERTAIEFAANTPSVAMIGGGILDHENGAQNARSVYLLNWLVGNLEKEGGLIIPRRPKNFPLKAEHLKHSPLNSWQALPGREGFYASPSQIDTYFAFLSNPAYSDPDCKSTARFFKNEETVPFLIVMDTHLTETAMMADMLLPAATYLESWGISSHSASGQVPAVNLKQPAVAILSPAQALRSPDYEMGKLLEPSFKPKGESEEIGNVCLELSRRIGSPISDRLPFKNTKDYCTKIALQIPGLESRGGFKRLQEDGVWVDTDSKKSNLASSQKIEMSSRLLEKNNNSTLPEYLSIAYHKDLEEDEFVLTTFKSNLYAKGTSNSKWAREILHENPLWLNKQAASRLDLKHGDRVRIISSVGALITRVHTTHRIHPQSVALAEGLGHTATGNVAKAKRFKSNDQDSNLIWWSKAGSGVNPHEIIERRTDPLGGGLSLKDTVVRIERLT